MTPIGGRDYLIVMQGNRDVFHFNNSYVRLPERFYERIRPTPVSSPKLVLFNAELADKLGLSLLDQTDAAQIFSGNELPKGAEPIALAYAGHQFGNFVPQLGDGRAVLIGEIDGFDIQLKGSGPTKFSRRGDGRAALGPAIREFVLSEAMHALGLPTTRSLAVVTTGEMVFRERPLPGAIVTRVSRGHVRVGTFEYFAARQDGEALRLLADYVIERNFPELRESKNPYLELYQKIVSAQAKLISKWMHVGFIHGVMNTDNMAISGETIDYGPCAFLDAYDAATVFSSIDQFGRYAFGNQAKIAQWNLQSLGACLSPLYATTSEQAGELITQELGSFREQFERHWREGMAKKLGLSRYMPDDLKLIDDLLGLMEKSGADYTLSFRYLSVDDESSIRSFLELFSEREGLEIWLASWRKRIALENRPEVEVTRAMRAVNPIFIARNHRVEQAIDAAVNNDDLSETRRLIEVLKRPFDAQPGREDYALPPRPEERVLQTFCGT